MGIFFINPFHGRQDGNTVLTTPDDFSFDAPMYTARVTSNPEVEIPPMPSLATRVEACGHHWSTMNMVITRVDKLTSQLMSTRSIWAMTAQRCSAQCTVTRDNKRPRSGNCLKIA